MDTTLVLLALLSALLHAAWNAAVKSSAAPVGTMAAQMTAAAVIGAVGLPFTGLPAAASWSWLILGTALNMVAVAAMLRAYEEGGFGTVYPIVRATSVLSVAAAAPVFFGERIGAWALAGVACVAGALLLLAHEASRAGGAGSARALPRAALGWTLLAGLFTGLCVLCDAQGVRASGSAWAYGFAASITNAAAMGWRQRALGNPWAVLVRHARVGVPAGVVAMVSYPLILWVYTRAPVAPAAALRDMSAVFAMIIAVVWLKESMPPRRLAIVALALAGVPMMRLG